MSAENRERHSVMRSQERSHVGQFDTPEAVLVGVLQIAQALDDLVTAIDEMAVDMARRSPEPMPTECRERTCSYVRHYLAQGPADLVHEGFHAAEERCTQAHNEIELHYKDHPQCGAQGTACHRYQNLEKQAGRWEDLVRA